LVIKMSFTQKLLVAAATVPLLAGGYGLIKYVRSQDNSRYECEGLRVGGNLVYFDQSTGSLPFQKSNVLSIAVPDTEEAGHFAKNITYIDHNGDLMVDRIVVDKKDRTRVEYLSSDGIGQTVVAEGQNQFDATLKEILEAKKRQQGIRERKGLEDIK